MRRIGFRMIFPQLRPNEGIKGRTLSGGGGLLSLVRKKGSGGSGSDWMDWVTDELIARPR